MLMKTEQIKTYGYNIVIVVGYNNSWGTHRNWYISHNFYISHPSHKTMADILWKLLILLQLLQEDTAKRQKDLKEEQLEAEEQILFIRYFWKKDFHLKWIIFRLHQQTLMVKKTQCRRSVLHSLVVKLVKVLHVPKDDVFLVDNTRRNLFHTAGHLP